MIQFDLAAALSELARVRGELKIAWEEANKTSIEMDGRMQSRYDTQKEEYAGRANMIMMQIQRNERLADMLKETLISPKADTISVGNRVELQMNDETEPMYLILLDDQGGGNLCGFDLISVNSPLGKSIVGKKNGEKVEYVAANRKIGLRIIDFS